MRCPEVMQELSAPGAPLDASALAEHLARCPTCAQWAGDVAQFDRLWAETRPLEPDPGQFERLWIRVGRAAEQVERSAAGPMTLSMAAPAQSASFSSNGDSGHGRVRRSWAERGMLVSGLAAAAVLLVVLMRPMFLGRPADPGPLALTRPTPLVVKTFDTEPGQTLFIEVSGSNITAESRPPADVSDTITVAAELDILNFMESQSPEAL
jgi:hypothetical protein